nr:anthrone oxygenase family protein [uncultured Devosia sp.]
MPAILPTLAQVTALVLLGLVVGSMFGIWRGYDITTYAPATFIEVHQGSVRGLNVLLPALAAASLILVLILAAIARQRPAVLGLYLATAAAIIAGGVITRLLNQPINDQVMAWTSASIPADWTALRDRWWSWHQVRLAVTLGAQLLLIAAIFADRDA